MKDRKNGGSNIPDSILLDSKNNGILVQNHFEQFFLIGVPPNSSNTDTPEILVAFPPYQSTEIDFRIIIHYALPFGVVPRNNKTGNNIIQDEFCFLFSTATSQIYGMCVHILPSMSNLPFFVSRDNKNKIYCYCLLTKVPTFSTHFLFLSFLALDMSSAIKDVFSIRCNPNHIEASGPSFPNMDETNSIAHLKTLKIPNRLISLLHIYHQYSPGNPSINLSRTIELFFPPYQQGKSILYASLDTLFSILEPKQIVDILCGALLDRQVLVFGTSLLEVSMTIFAIHQLIDPLEYSGLVIPILPQRKEYFMLLQAPTPFLIGTLPSDTLLDIDFLDTVVFVNLDTKLVQTEPNFPKYPNRNAIATKLTKLLTQGFASGISQFNLPHVFKSLLKHRYSFPPVTSETVTNTLKEPLSQIFSDFIFCFFMTNLDVSGQSTIFNRDIFLSTVQPEDIEFYKALLTSQTFEMFISLKLKEFMALKGQDINQPVFESHGSKLTRKNSRRMSCKVLGVE